MHDQVPASLASVLHADIEDLAEVDVAPLGDAELCALTAEVYRAEARLAAARSRLVGEVDRRDAYRHVGAQSAGAYFSTVCRLPIGSARHDVRVARALRHLPRTAERFARGALGETQVRMIAGHHANGRVREVLERDEDMLSNEGSKLSFSLFRKTLGYWAQLADPDGTDDDAEARRARRRLHLSRTMDGCWKIDGLFDPVEGAAFDAALRRIDDELHRDDKREARERLGREPICADLGRSARQRRADALAEMGQRASSTPPGARRPAPLVSVLVGYETFAGRVCELADGSVLAPADVAALLDEALIERVVFDSPARVMEVSQQRTFRGALRRAMQLRDRVCWHEYCEEPAERCDGDHRIPYATGGPTADWNSRPGCVFHNRIEPQRRRGRDPDGHDP